MSADRFTFLLSKKFSASLTAEEEAELQALLQDADNEQSYRLLKKFWQAKEIEQTPNVEKALASVLQKIEEEKPAPPVKISKPRRPFPFLKIAVAASFILLAGYFFFQQSKTVTGAAKNSTPPSVASVVEKQNAKGTRSIITLADGSKVWLNADSKLQYPVAFEGATREVSLSGEAFFEVAKNKQKPFIIHLKNGTVRVLGTSFNIRAYDNSPSVETSVATGRVAFIPSKTSGAKKADTVFLTHDLKVVYTIKTGAVKTVQTSSTVDKAWTEGKLLFTSAGMDEIATTLERYFGKQVVINDEELHAYHFNGSFENDSIEEILYYLSKSKPFTYRITETQIILSAVR